MGGDIDESDSDKLIIDAILEFSREGEVPFEKRFEVLVASDFAKGPLPPVVHVEVIVVVEVNVVRGESWFLDGQSQVGQFGKRLQATALAF